jgi:hypothetical protein
MVHVTESDATDAEVKSNTDCAIATSVSIQSKEDVTEPTQSAAKDTWINVTSQNATAQDTSASAETNN